MMKILNLNLIMKYKNRRLLYEKRGNMEELIIGTIIKLRNGKEYIVADNCKINSIQYVILTNNEENDEEEIFVLKNCKDKNNQYFLQSTSEEEFNSVINYYRELYTELGVYDGQKLNFSKIYNIYRSESELIKKAKSKIENEAINKQNSVKTAEVMEKSKKIIEKYEKDIEDLKKENIKLQEGNEFMNERINKLPKIIQKIFLKDDKKLLN